MFFIQIINNLKKRQDQFESSTLSNLSNFKNEIINDLNISANSLLIERQKHICPETK
jgi:hypothetical protein